MAHLMAAFHHESLASELGNWIILEQIQEIKCHLAPTNACGIRFHTLTFHMCIGHVHEVLISHSQPHFLQEICSPKSTSRIWQRVVKEFLDVLFCGLIAVLLLGGAGVPGYSMTDSQGTLKWEPTSSAIWGKFITGHCLGMNWEEDTRGTKGNAQMHPRFTTL